MKKQKTTMAVKAVSNPATDDTAACQSAINAMAQALYMIKQANKCKTAELEQFKPAVDVDEAPFLAGVPFAFPFETAEGACTVTGKLKLRNQRVWDLADVVVKGA